MMTKKLVVLQLLALVFLSVVPAIGVPPEIHHEKYSDIELPPPSSEWWLRLHTYYTPGAPFKVFPVGIYHVENPGKPVFTVERKEIAAYWKVDSFDRYTKRGWEKSSLNLYHLGVYRLRGVEETVKITPSGLVASQTLPHPLPEPKYVGFVQGGRVARVTTDRYGAQVFQTFDPVPGDLASYRVAYTLQAWDPARIGGRIPPDVVEAFTQLPSELPPELDELVEKLRDPDADVYQQVVRVVDHLKTNYEYSTVVPQRVLGPKPLLRSVKADLSDYAHKMEEVQRLLGEAESRIRVGDWGEGLARVEKASKEFEKVSPVVEAVSPGLSKKIISDLEELREKVVRHEHDPGIIRSVKESVGDTTEKTLGYLEPLDSILKDFRAVEVSVEMGEWREALARVEKASKEFEKVSPVVEAVSPGLSKKIISDLEELREKVGLRDADASKRMLGDLPVRDPLKFFFEEKKGGPDLFTTAFVLLIRRMGIPARYTVGFAPGEIEGEKRVVKAGHAHVWAEVYMPPYGWVMVDPTGGTKESLDLPKSVGQDFNVHYGNIDVKAPNVESEQPQTLPLRLSISMDEDKAFRGETFEFTVKTKYLNLGLPGVKFSVMDETTNTFLGSYKTGGDGRKRVKLVFPLETIIGPHRIVVVVEPSPQHTGARVAFTVVVVSPTSLTISVDNTRPSVGDTIRVSGRLLDDHSNPLGNRRILVHHYAGVGEAFTDENGEYNYLLPIKLSRSSFSIYSEFVPSENEFYGGSVSQQIEIWVARPGEIAKPRENLYNMLATLKRLEESINEKNTEKAERELSSVREELLRSETLLGQEKTSEIGEQLDELQRLIRAGEWDKAKDKIKQILDMLMVEIGTKKAIPKTRLVVVLVLILLCVSTLFFTHKRFERRLSKFSPIHPRRTIKKFFPRPRAAVSPTRTGREVVTTPRVAPNPGSGSESTLDTEHTAVPPQTQPSPEEILEKYGSRGDYRRAILETHPHLIETLEKHTKIVKEPHTTQREYYGLISSVGKVPDVGRDVVSLIHTFEEAYYSHHPFEKKRFERYREALRNVLRALGDEKIEN